MANRKEHLEFHQIDLQTGWRTPPGYPSEIQQKILAGALNEVAKTGTRTRLLRFGAGARTTQPFVHDYWEEVSLLSGDLVVGDETSGLTLQNYSANTYACRLPGSIMALSDPGRGACCLSSTTTSNRSDEELGQWLLSVRNNVSRRIGQSARVLHTVGGKISAPGAPFAPA